MKKVALSLILLFSVQAVAGLPEMMKIYNNPKTAPKIKACKGDVYCNAFIALSKQWKDIPNNYRYQGKYDIKSYAKIGITYDEQGRNIGLQRGFYFYTTRSNNLIGSIDAYIDNVGHIADINYEGGLAVLLYIEDRNGWIEPN